MADRERALRDLLSSDRPYLTMGGVETHLLFTQQFPLRDFCAFELFDDEKAFATFEREFLRPTADAALANGLGLVLDTLVWRASTDWLDKLGHGRASLERINRAAVARMRRFANEWRASAGPKAATVPVVLTADIGPRGDGYRLQHGRAPTSGDARAYHEPQIAALASTDIDAVCALTMTSAEEAIGLVEAAKAHGLPVFVSPTVETDGTVPDGRTLAAFIQDVDAATGGAPAFYGANCAHPTHIVPVLARAKRDGERWLARFRGFRANASAKSHQELDNSTALDAGNRDDLAARLGDLRHSYNLRVVGGCCGTDATHLAAIARACTVRRV